MSKIGRLPIAVPTGITITITGQNVVVAGAKGSMSFVMPQGITAAVADGKIVVSQVVKDEATKPVFGLTRATLANLVQGVHEGFEKKLELVGVGYRAQMAGTDLNLSLGFSHPVKIQAPAGITFAVVDNAISIKGMDIALVGNTAAKIRAIRPPEPYKGKGIKYAGEKIRRKAGKAAKAVGGAPGAK